MHLHCVCLLICSLLGCSFAQLTEKPINLLGLQGANNNAPKQTAGYFKVTCMHGIAIVALPFMRDTPDLGACSSSTPRQQRCSTSILRPVTVQRLPLWFFG